MQIDGGAGADVAADVGVQELGAPASNIQLGAHCTHPHPKCQPLWPKCASESKNVHLHLTECTTVTPPELKCQPSFSNTRPSGQNVPQVFRDVHQAAHV